MVGMQPGPILNFDVSLLCELRCSALLAEIDRLDDKLFDAEGYIAFKARSAGDAELQKKFLRAAEYCDEMTAVRDKAGKVLGGVCVWFVCMSNYDQGCVTLTGSKRWLQKFPDALARKQKWACPYCHANYKASWGMIMEFTLLDGSRYYARSEVDDRMMDLKAMALEERFNPSSPEELYDAIPEVFPYTGQGSLWRPATSQEVWGQDPTGVFRCTVPGPKAYMESMPWWKWEHVMCFFRGQQ